MKSRRGLFRISGSDRREKSKSVEIALVARKLNESSIKLKPHLPSMEELLDQMSTEITRVQSEPLWVIKIDLQYAYGQIFYPKKQVIIGILK